jgi:diguanylate cyclase (GGDEF)-like protein
MPEVTRLCAANQAPLSTFDVDAVLREILAAARDRFQLPRVAIFLREGTNLSLHSCSGWPTESSELLIPIGRGIIGEAAELIQILNVPDVRKQHGDAFLVSGMRSELAVPLVICDEVVGVFDFQCDREEFFDKETIELLTQSARHASLALRHAQLHRKEQRHAAQLRAVSAIARQTTDVTDLNELLARLCALLLQGFPVDHVALLLIENQRLVLRAHCGKLQLSFHNDYDSPADKGLCVRALATENAVLCNDVSLEPDCLHWFAKVGSELCLPLISFGQSLGVLSLCSTRKSALDDSELHALESVADICASVIQNAIHFNQVRHVAERDGLTGVFNRQFFDTRIGEELERSRRYRSEMVLLMIDLDGFKGINDEFGHLLGDEALRQISAIFSQHVRKSDIICRFGGDEFAILLPETSTRKAYGAAEKLRRMVAELEIPGVTRPMTLSIGMASFPEDAKTRDELIKAADHALYRAKEGGRNRAVTYRATSYTAMNTLDGSSD